MEGMREWEEKQGRGEDEPEHPPRLPAPWEAEDESGQEADGPRHRHDGFTPARRRAFLKALSKSGCILDACREIGISSTTLYRHQREDGEFLRHCTLAIQMARTPVELAAWERGVTGVEEEYVRGGQVYTRIRRSDSILRLLLQGANPKKYGARPGFTRKRLLAHERKQIEEEVRARIAAATPPIERVRESILTKIDNIERHQNQQRLAGGWTLTEDGDWIPPGYGPIPGWSPPDPEPGADVPPAP
jgi:AraC-like DNA-binding protein